MWSCSACDSRTSGCRTMSGRNFRQIPGYRKHRSQPQPDGVMHSAHGPQEFLRSWKHNWSFCHHQPAMLGGLTPIFNTCERGFWVWPYNCRNSRCCEIFPINPRVSRMKFKDMTYNIAFCIGYDGKVEWCGNLQPFDLMSDKHSGRRWIIW